jgi:hypothetical protein
MMPSTKTFEILFEQNHVGAFLSDIDRGVDGDADVGGF